MLSSKFSIALPSSLIISENLQCVLGCVSLPYVLVVFMMVPYLETLFCQPISKTLNLIVHRPATFPCCGCLLVMIHPITLPLLMLMATFNHSFQKSEQGQLSLAEFVLWPRRPSLKGFLSVLDKVT